MSEATLTRESRGLDSRIPWYQRSFGRAMSDAALLVLTRQFSGLVGAGVPAVEALDVAIESAKDKQSQRILQIVAADVRNGQTLAGALARHPNAFPDFYVAMVRAAETSGNLAGTFVTLAGYIERSLNSKRAIRSALYYPAVLVVLSLVAVVVLSVVILPKFVAFFASLNAELPLPTRVLLGGVSLMSSKWYVLIGGVILLAAGFVALRRTESGALIIDRVLLRLPVVGPTSRLINLERFAQMLSSLVSAGVPLPDALTLSANSMPNAVYKRALLSIRQSVLSGQGLVGPLRATNIFPSDTIQILEVGERSGRLGDQLGHAAQYYGADVDYRLKNITALIEPIILLVVGAVVGFVAIALVSAMYGIYSSNGLESV